MKEVKFFRSLWHVASGSLIAFLYNFIDKDLAIMILSYFLLVFFFFEISRLCLSARLNELVTQKIFKYLFREEEEHKITSSAWFLLGVLFTVFFFPKEITQMAILVLSISDPLAAFWGRRYGRILIVPGKTWMGALAFFVSASIISFFFVGISGCVFVGISGTLAEVFSYKFNVDDNFSIPVICAVSSLIFL